MSAGTSSPGSLSRSGRSSLLPLFLGPAPPERLGAELVLPFTAFLPDLLWAVVTVQFFEELGWAGSFSTGCRHGTAHSWAAPVVVGPAYVFLHPLTYLSVPAAS